MTQKHKDYINYLKEWGASDEEAQYGLDLLLSKPGQALEFENYLISGRKEYAKPDGSFMTRKERHERLANEYKRAHRMHKEGKNIFKLILG